MIEWNGAFGWAAIFSLVSFGTVLFVAIKGLGIREADTKTLAKRFEALEHDVETIQNSRADNREADRKEREGFQISVNAGLEMMRSNLSDFQRLAAERYATKIEVSALEERTNKGMDRIVDRLEQISNRLETIGDAIIKTLADQNRQHR